MDIFVTVGDLEADVSLSRNCVLPSRSRDVPYNCTKLRLGKCMGLVLWNKGENKV